MRPNFEITAPILATFNCTVPNEPKIFKTMSTQVLAPQPISTGIIRVLKFSENGKDYYLCSNCNPFFLYSSISNSIYQRIHLERKTLTYSKVFSYESLQHKPTRFNNTLRKRQLAAKASKRQVKPMNYKLVFSIFSEADILHMMYITKKISMETPKGTIDLELYVDNLPQVLSNFLLSIPFATLEVSYCGDKLH